jgi:DNA-binding transcriptional LysR family regulator
VNHNDPLAARKAVTLETIRERPLISLPRGTGIRSLIDEACAAAGFRPRIAFEAGDPNVLAQLASRGLGVAVLPESLADFYREELHAIAITRPGLRGRLELAWRAEGTISPAARALIGRACDMLEDQPAHPL